MKIAILSLILVILATVVTAADEVTCKSLDTREFGIVSDGEITESWSEAKLIVRYGPPCQIIELGEVYIERSKGRILEIEPKTFEQEKLKRGMVAIKKQLIYRGDDSSRASIFTIIEGVVVKKERIF